MKRFVTTVLAIGCLNVVPRALGAELDIQLFGQGRDGQSSFDTFLDETIVPMGQSDSAPFGTVGVARTYTNGQLPDGSLLNMTRQVDELEYAGFASFDRLGAFSAIRGTSRYTYGLETGTTARFADTYTIHAQDPSLDGTAGIARFKTRISGSLTTAGEFVDEDDKGAGADFRFFEASYIADVAIGGSRSTYSQRRKNFQGNDTQTEESGNEPGVVTRVFTFTYGDPFEFEASLGVETRYQTVNLAPINDDNRIEAAFLSTLAFSDLEIVERTGSRFDPVTDFTAIPVDFSVTTESGVNAFVPEPTSLAIFALGGLTLLRRRRCIV